MTEEWRWVKGYEGVYEVSSLGNVRHYKKGIPQKAHTYLDAGYECIKLYANKKRKGSRVHNLVAETFISPKKAGYQVHHIDGNKHNNRLDNLAYISSKEHHQITAQETGIGRRLGEWCKKNNSKTVVAMSDDYDYLVIFQSATDAGLCLGVDSSVIREVAKDFWTNNPKRKHAYGFRWADIKGREELCYHSNVWHKVQVEIVGFSPITIQINPLFWTQELESKILKRGSIIT